MSPRRERARVTAPSRASRPTAAGQAPTSGFHYTRRVQFAETDLAGVVHFSWYLRYMEEAEHAMWREAGISVAPAGSDLGFPRVAAEIEYHAPLHFEDVIDVHVRVEAITRRTIRYAHRITRGDTQVATGSMTAVCVRTQPAMRAVNIPADILRKLTTRAARKA
jgi:YbgC/YbaW family acyl-CoA thioester hydrolase